jgi:hypothetical protein
MFGTCNARGGEERPLEDFDAENDGKRPLGITKR